MLSTEIEYLGGCIVEQPEASVNINNNPINLTLSFIIFIIYPLS